MAEKIIIEIYKNKTPDELTKLIADPAGRLETGSGSAVIAAISAAFLERAAVLTGETVKDNDRVEYIIKNSEIIRSYMIHLIDEDVKSRGPLRRAIKEGGAREIEAARQPAVTICAEIVNMMGKCLEFVLELAEFCPEDARHYLAESAEAAVSASKSAVHYILDMASKCSDETYRFVSCRENELTLEQQMKLYGEILEKVN